MSLIKTYKITPKEMETIVNIVENCYGDYATDEVWTFSVADGGPFNIPKTSVPGRLGSLQKKGMVDHSKFESSGNGLDDDSTTWVTDLGAQVYLEWAVANSRKEGREFALTDEQIKEWL